MCLYLGCTLIQALNFDPSANEDDGSCLVRDVPTPPQRTTIRSPQTTTGVALLMGSIPRKMRTMTASAMWWIRVGTLDSCGVCNGSGPILECGCNDIPSGACDCEGNALDALGVCGGNCKSRPDEDSCDDMMTASACWMNVVFATGRGPPTNAAATTFLRANAIVTAASWTGRLRRRLSLRPKQQRHLRCHN